MFLFQYFSYYFTGGNSDAPAIETVSAPFGSDIEMKCDPNLEPPVKFHWKKLEGIMPQNIDPYEVRKKFIVMKKIKVIKLIFT